MKIIFASHNQNKIKQVKEILKDFEVVGLNEIGFNQEIEENEKSFRGNAQLKAQFVHNVTGEVCIADDSGICIDALDGWPGVQTHRFLGENATQDQRNDLILAKLKGIAKRECSVICSICLVDKQGNVTFKEGFFESTIAHQKSGNNKFGFDEILMYKDGKTLAEFSDQEKIQVNARSIALKKIMPILLKLEQEYQKQEKPNLQPNIDKIFVQDQTVLQSDNLTQNQSAIQPTIKQEISNKNIDLKQQKKQEKMLKQQEEKNRKEQEIEQKHILIKSLLSRL